MNNSSFIARLRDVKKSMQDVDPDVVVADIMNERWILHIDTLAQHIVKEYTADWIERYSPPKKYGTGTAVFEWIVGFNTIFVHDLFSPDNMKGLWNNLRSRENSSILKYVLDLTSYFRQRVLANDDDVVMLIKHLSSSYCWVHNSDMHLMDGISKDYYAIDEQLFDELPTASDVDQMLLSNTWLVPILYITRFTVTDLDNIADRVFKQTREAEEKEAKTGVGA